MLSDSDEVFARFKALCLEAFWPVKFGSNKMRS